MLLSSSHSFHMKSEDIYYKFQVGYEIRLLVRALGENRVLGSSRCPTCMGVLNRKHLKTCTDLLHLLAIDQKEK